jgi:hypothetical protein
VYVDESGNLAVADQSSRILTLGAVATCTPQELDRIPLSVRRKRLKRQLSSVPELKFHSSSSAVRMLVLGLVADLPEAQIAGISIDKTRLYAAGRLKGDAIYMLAVTELVSELLALQTGRGSLHLTFDARPFEKALSRAFDRYVIRAVEGECTRMRIAMPELRVSRFDSVNSKGLQVADFVAGAIRRKYEMDDSSYYDIIAPRIVCDKKIP